MNYLDSATISYIGTFCDTDTLISLRVCSSYLYKKINTDESLSVLTIEWKLEKQIEFSSSTFWNIIYWRRTTTSTKSGYRTNDSKSLEILIKNNQYNKIKKYINMLDEGEALPEYDTLKDLIQLAADYNHIEILNLLSKYIRKDDLLFIPSRQKLSDKMMKWLISKLNTKLSESIAPIIFSSNYALIESFPSKAVRTMQFCDNLAKCGNIIAYYSYRKQFDQCFTNLPDKREFYGFLDSHRVNILMEGCVKRGDFEGLKYLKGYYTNSDAGYYRINWYKLSLLCPLGEEIMLSYILSKAKLSQKDDQQPNYVKMGNLEACKILSRVQTFNADHLVDAIENLDYNMISWLLTLDGMIQRLPEVIIRIINYANLNLAVIRLCLELVEKYKKDFKEDIISPRAEYLGRGDYMRKHYSANLYSSEGHHWVIPKESEVNKYTMICYLSCRRGKLQIIEYVFNFCVKREKIDWDYIINNVHMKTELFILLREISIKAGHADKWKSKTYL